MCRLAPESPWPAAVHDTWESLLWSIGEGAQLLNLDLNRYAVGGSSAGGNLAAVMAQKLLSRPEIKSKLKIRLQLLTVPVTDNTATVETNKTWKACEFTPALSAVKMLWYRDHYLPDPATRSDPEASPLLFPTEKFAELPPAQILVGEMDVLRHEGEEFARKLREAGVQADVEVMKGMPHRKFLCRPVVKQITYKSSFHGHGCRTRRGQKSHYNHVRESQQSAPLGLIPKDSFGTVV